MRKLMLAGFLAFVALARANAQATAPALSGDQVVDHVSPAVVLILVSTATARCLASVPASSFALMELCSPPTMW